MCKKSLNKALSLLQQNESADNIEVVLSEIEKITEYFELYPF